MYAIRSYYDEEGKDLLHFVEFDFAELLGDVCRKLKGLADKKNIDIETELTTQCYRNNFV